MARAWLILLLLCGLLLTAVPAGTAEARLMPGHPVAMAHVRGAGEAGHHHECHRFLHASGVVAMAAESRADRDPPQPAAIAAGWPRPVSRAGRTTEAASSPDPRRGLPPLYAMTGRLRL